MAFISTGKSPFQQLMESMKSKSAGDNSMQQGVNMIAKNKIDMLTEQLKKQQMIPALDELGLPREWINLPTPALTQAIKQAQQQKVRQQYLSQYGQEGMTQPTEQQIPSEEQIPPAQRVEPPPAQQDKFKPSSELMAAYASGAMSEDAFQKAILKEKDIFNKGKTQEFRVDTEITKFNQPYLDKYNKKKAGSAEHLQRIKRIRHELEKGNVDEPLTLAAYNFLESRYPSLGKFVGSIKKAGTGVIEKLISQNLRGILDDIGAKGVSQRAIDFYMKQYESLTSKREAMKEVMDIFELGSKQDEIEAWAANQVNKKARKEGRLPENFDYQVSELAQPKIDKLHDDFYANLNKMSKKAGGKKIALGKEYNGWNAADYKGKTIVDTDERTGKVKYLESTGDQWLIIPESMQPKKGK